jgi:hypothetical protein
MKPLATAEAVGIFFQLRFYSCHYLVQKAAPLRFREKVIISALGKEGPGEISSITCGFHISEKTTGDGQQ